jgi:hypothetical protein
MRRMQSTVGLACLLLLALGSTCYVAAQALKEDNTMRPGSLVARALVDTRLWDLEPPPGCTREAYYTTTGDGPKLPGSDTTLRCALDVGAARQWAHEWLLDAGFTVEVIPSSSPSGRPPRPRYVTDEHLASVEIVEGGEDLMIRIGIWDLPRYP